MDLTEMNERAGNIIKILKSLPKVEKIHFPQYKLSTEASNDKLSKLALNCCKPILEKLLAEAIESMEEYDDKFFERVENRRDFIEKQIEQNNMEMINQREKLALVKEIEFYEKQNIRRFNKIIFTEDESKNIIKMLHESRPQPTNIHLQHYLRKYVDVKYERLSEKEVVSLKRIIGILGHTKD